jgi:RHS repeat-associated protein
VALVHPSRVIKLNYTYEGEGPFHAPKAIETDGTVHEPLYDPNGNMTVSPNLADPENVPYREISYNAENMPSQISLPGEDPTGTNCSGGQPEAECTQKEEFIYDGENKRARKTSSTGSTYYIGEHFEIIDGIPIKYIFAGNLRIARITSTDTQYFHKDHLQSSTAVTNDLGEKVETTEYFPFGYERSHTGLRTSNYKYTDQELDPESGLYNYDARLYDPVIARFIVPDTLIQDYYNPESLNRYSYALNNPLLYNDPDGHFAITATIALGFLAAKAIAIGVSYIVTRTVVEGIGDPVIPSDVPNQSGSDTGGYHLSDFTNDTFAGLSGLAAGESAIIAAGKLAATNPVVVKNAVEFGIGSAVPGPPPPTKWGMVGFVTGRMALAGKGLYENLNANGATKSENNSFDNSTISQSNQTKDEYQIQDKGQIKSENSNAKMNAKNAKQKKYP